MPVTAEHSAARGIHLSAESARVIRGVDREICLSHRPVISLITSDTPLRGGDLDRGKRIIGVGTEGAEPPSPQIFFLLFKKLSTFSVFLNKVAEIRGRT